MTAAAGFPIAPTTAGAPAAPSVSKSANSEATSFRVGLEALLNPVPATQVPTGPVRTTPTDAKYSDVAQSEIAEASDSPARAGQSDAKPAHFLQNGNQNKPGVTRSSTSEPAVQSQPQQTQSLTSATALPASRILQPEQIVFSISNSAKAADPLASGKQNSSEHAGQQKQSAAINNDPKAISQTILSPSEAFVPVPVPISNPASDSGHGIEPRATSISTASDQAELTAETARGNTSPVFTLSASTSSTATELEGKTVSIAAAIDAAPVNPTEATAARVSSNYAESAAQSTLQHSKSPIPSPDTDSIFKASSTQSDSGSVSNTLQPVFGRPQSLGDASPAHTPLNHGPASRERVPLARDLSNAGAQQNIAIASQTTLTRDSSGIAGVPAERAGGNAQSAQPQIVSPAARDTFTALDADPGQPSATWVHASPRQVEAGYQDPSLGWVSVRADLTPNGLHASVVPNSPEAAQALGSHLSGLNAYLAEHHDGSITASLAAPENHSSTPDQSLGQNPSQHSQSGAQPQKESNESAAAQAVPSQAISTGSAQTSDPAVPVPGHTGLISVIA